MSAAIKGGFFAQYGTTLSTAHTRSALRRTAAMALSKRQTLPLQKIMRTLDGVVAGSTATKTVSRVVSAMELGGKRTVETVNLVNRATVAGDVTDINADILTHSSYAATPKVNLDGNKAIMGIAH